MVVLGVVTTGITLLPLMDFTTTRALFTNAIMMTNSTLSAKILAPESSPEPKNR